MMNFYRQLFLVSIFLVLPSLLFAISPLDDNWDFLAKKKALAIDYSVMHSEMLAQINKLRLNPQDFAAHYKTVLLEYKVGKKENFIALRSVTKGDPRVLENVVTYLDELTGALELEEAEGLSKAALDHVNDLATLGIKSHVGSNGMRVAQRVKKYGEWKQHVTEVLLYGYITPDEMMLAMLAAKGREADENRKLLMSRSYTKVGAACKQHATDLVMCDIVLAVDFSEPVITPQVEAQNPVH